MVIFRSSSKHWVEELEKAQEVFKPEASAGAERYQWILISLHLSVVIAMHLWKVK